jgi:site-specific DNA recombinase
VSTVGRSRMEPDPERADLVRKAFHLFATGNFEKTQVLTKVTAMCLRSRKGGKLSPQTFSRILTNPIYMGRVSIPKWEMDSAGSFVPLVGEETFRRVQVVLAGRRVTTGPYHKNHPDFPLRHFIRCEHCEKPLTASWSKGRSRKYAYYRCPRSECKRVKVSKQILEDGFLELLVSLRPKPEYLRLFEAVILDVWKTKQADANRCTLALRKRIESLSGRKNQLVEAYLYERTIDKETYQDQLDRLRQDITLAEMELTEARVDEIDIEGVINFATVAIGDASRFWIDGSLDQKQRFQRILFPEGVTFDGKRVGTPATCLAFSYLREVSQRKVSLASRTGVEPVSPP